MQWLPMVVEDCQPWMPRVAAPFVKQAAGPGSKPHRGTGKAIVGRPGGAIFGMTAADDVDFILSLLSHMRGWGTSISS